MFDAKALLATTMLLASGGALAQIMPDGGEFQVNSYTTSYQQSPAVARAPDGAFVVVWGSWGSYGPDTDGGSIQAQRYSSSGDPIGGQFQVNVDTSFGQGAPKIAIDEVGNFVVAWQDGSTGELTISAQRFDADGTPLGGQFQVNSYPIGYGWWYMLPHSIAADPNGNFVVAWTSIGSVGSDTSGFSIQAQRFAASGTPLGGQFQVNSYTTWHQNGAAVALDPAGNFVIAWTSQGSTGPDTDYSIQAQRFAADGSALGAEFQVNSYTTGSQYGADVAYDPAGRFVVTWSSTGSSGSDTSSSSIQARRFDAAGNPQGAEFQVNTFTPGQQGLARVASDSRGGFVVAWTSEGSSGSDSSSHSIHAQRFHVDGIALGGEFQVNTYTTGLQWFPDLASDDLGNFVVVWESGGSSGSDTSESSIQGQRYEGALFRDGFETGDTSRWSGAVP